MKVLENGQEGQGASESGRDEVELALALTLGQEKTSASPPATDVTSCLLRRPLEG